MVQDDLRVAFVVQRYGLEVNGGAELHCRWVAEHLVPYAEVHVFTTCAQDYVLWKNAYPPGDTELNGVHVHRFPVDSSRRPRRFARASETILTQSHPYLDEWVWMKEQGPVSHSLLEAIEHRRGEFDVFIFFTYLYATTYYGIQLVPDKAMLVPTAHDEPTLYLPIFRSVFHLPKHILYNTRTERSLVQSVFHNEAVPSTVVGTGIEVPERVDAQSFRRKYKIEDDFTLYIGRLDESKNLAELFAHFERYRESMNSDLKLILLGRGPFVVPERDAVVPLGFVSEEDKFNALAACSVLLLPSRYESLSMVVLEAWLMRKPVLVNGSCEVLREQCLRSNGGLYYRTYQEFAIALDLLMRNEQLRDQLGQQGQEFATTEYDWNTIESKYLRAIARYLGVPDVLTDQS